MTLRSQDRTACATKPHIRVSLSEQTCCAGSRRGWRNALETYAEISQFLQEHCSRVQIVLINTRILLETGINLDSVPTQGDEEDDTALAKIRAILTELEIRPP